MTTISQPYSAWNVEEYDFPRHGMLGEKLKFLLNYAILAPSLHNTQPWKFAVHGNAIRVFADRTRHLQVADPNARELYISIGCALENLLTAATYFGLGANVTYFPDPKDEAWIATISFGETGITVSLNDQECFHSIPLRHTNRQIYVNKPLNDRDVHRLRGCLHKENITLQLTDNPVIKQAIDGLVISADITQFADPDYRDELNQWITQGEFGYRWLIARVGQLATTYLASHHKPTKPDADTVLNAPVLALLSTNSDDRLAQVKTGQVFERIALNATALNIGIQPLSQILQVGELKPEVSKLFTEGAAFPQMAFRLGYTDVAQDATARKQVDSVTIV
jgi:nitroreductase